MFFLSLVFWKCAELLKNDASTAETDPQHVRKDRSCGHMTFWFTKEWLVCHNFRTKLEKPILGMEKNVNLVILELNI